MQIHYLKRIKRIFYVNSRFSLTCIKITVLSEGKGSITLVKKIELLFFPRIPKLVFTLRSGPKTAIADPKKLLKHVYFSSLTSIDK